MNTRDRFNKAMGDLIYRERARAGMTQQECADILSISRPAFVNMEAGRQSIYVWSLVMLAETFNVPIKRLVPKP